MANFGPALEYLLNFEDAPRSYIEVTDNNGGKVIAGINSKSFPQAEEAIASLPQDQRSSQVYQFYYAHFWVPMKLGFLNSQDVANRVLDMAVNAGEGNAELELQKAICEVRSGACEIDGVIGPITLAAANSVDQGELLLAFRAQRVNYYEAVEAKHPEDETYLKTWLARAEA